MKNIALILIVSTILCGCKQDSTKKPRTRKSSATKSAIEGMTGYTAVKSGTQTANKIKDTSATRQNDLDDVLGK